MFTGSTGGTTLVYWDSTSANDSPALQTFSGNRVFDNKLENPIDHPVITVIGGLGVFSENLFSNPEQRYTLKTSGACQGCVIDARKNWYGVKSRALA